MNQEYSEKDTAYFNSSRLDVLKFIPVDTKTILDVGTGEGNFLKEAKSQLGLETWGIELENKAYEKAKSKIDRVFLGTVEDNLQNLPDDYFDCITFNDVLEHLLEPWHVIQQITPKLKKGGSLIASIPNVRYIKNLQNLLLKGDWKYEDSGILDITHLRFFTKKSIPNLFLDKDYSIAKLEGINELRTGKIKAFNFITLGIFKDTLYMQFLVQALKK